MEPVTGGGDTSNAWAGRAPAGYEAPGCAWGTGAHEGPTANTYRRHGPGGHVHGGEQQEDVGDIATPPVSPDRDMVAASAEVRVPPCCCRG